MPTMLTSLETSDNDPVPSDGQGGHAACAIGAVRMSMATLALVAAGIAIKAKVVGVARPAGIMAVKNIECIRMVIDDGKMPPGFEPDLVGVVQ